MGDHNSAKKFGKRCELERASASISKTVIVATAGNCDLEENEEHEASSRTRGGSGIASNFSSASEETEDDDEKRSSRSMSKETIEIESDTDEDALEAISITQSRFKQPMQQDIPMQMRSDFQRKRKAKRKSYGGSSKKTKPSVKQERREGCCVYCFTDEDSDWKCGKLLKQHGIVIHQHCMVIFMQTDYFV